MPGKRIKLALIGQWRRPWPLLLSLCLYAGLSIVFVVANLPLLPVVPLLLTTFITLPTVWQQDFHNGSLALLLMQGVPLEQIALEQWATIWLIQQAPLLLIIGLQAGAWPGTELCFSIGITALLLPLAALTVQHKQAAMLAPILLLPLSVPLLIFATQPAETNSGFWWLFSLTCLYSAACPWITAKLLLEGLRNQ